MRKEQCRLHSMAPGNQACAIVTHVEWQGVTSLSFNIVGQIIYRNPVLLATLHEDDILSFFSSSPKILGFILN